MAFFEKNFDTPTNGFVDLKAKHNNHFKIKTKISVISFHKIKYPTYVEMIILFIEYFQLFSQITFIALESANEQTTLDNKFLSKIVIFVCQLFNPFYSMKSKDDLDRPHTIIILSLAICYIILKHALFLYLVRKSAHNIQSSGLLVNIWRWIFKLQGRVLYFIFSSFWVGVIRSISEDNIDKHSIKNISIMTISGLMILIEYVNTLYLLFNYCNILPTKSFLSEKDNKIQIMTVTQKLILQLFQITSCVSSLLFDAWVYSLICFLTNMIRNVQYFTKVPLYDLKALLYQGSLLMISTSLNLSLIVQAALKSLNNSKTEEFLWITFIILSVFMVKGSEVYLKKVIDDIVVNHRTNTPHFMLHKIALIKQIRKFSAGSSQNSPKYDFLCLLSQSINAKLNQILGIDFELLNEIQDINSKESTNRIFLNYLEILQIKFPKNDLIRLCLARFYAKKFRLYAKAVKIIQELRQSHSKLIRLNTSLLILDIQNIIKSRDEDQTHTINLSLFIRSQSQFAELKQKILKNVQLKTKLCEEIMKESPSLENINLWPQKIYSNRCKIDREIKLLLETIPDYFLEPIALLCHYFSIVSSHMSEVLKYQKLYVMKCKKYYKILKSINLKEENAYQSENIFLLLSGQKSDMGTILFCTESIKQLYGKDSKLIVGKNINTLVIPALQDVFSKGFKFQIEHGSRTNINHKPVCFFGQHNDGYMIELEYYINVYPFVNRSFCFAAILRQVKNSHESLLINEEGDIEGATKDIQERLSFKDFSKISSKNRLNIEMISKTLHKVNQNLGKIHLKEQTSTCNKDFCMEKICSKTIDEIQPQYIETDQSQQEKNNYSIYTTKGKNLMLRSLLNGETYLYNCKFLNTLPLESHMKILTLHTIGENEEGKSKNLKFKSKEDESNDSDQEKEEDKRPMELEEEEEKKKSCFEGSTQIIPKFLHKTANLSKPNRITMNSIPIQEIEKFQSSRTYEKIHTEASNLLSPLSSGKIKVSAQNNQFPLQFQNQKKEKVPKSFRLIDEDNKNENKVKELARKILPKGEGSVAESRISKDSKDVKVSDAFRAAVAVKSYPKYYSGLCLVSYLVLTGVFFLQIIVEATWEDNVNGLKVKKDILNNALGRNYFSVDIPLIFIVMQGVKNGKFDPSFYLPDVLMYFAGLDMIFLKQTNNILLNDTNSLSEEMRQGLFLKDIRFYDTCSNCSQKSYLKVDNFQATNMLVEFALGRKQIYTNNFSNFFEGIDLFYENCFNDLAVKNAEIVRIFSKLLDNQREDILVTMNTFLFLTIGLLILDALLIKINIFHWYLLEKQNIMAMFQLKPEGLNEFFWRLKTFEGMLKNHENFEQELNETLENSNFLEKASYLKEIKHKKEGLKIPNTKSFNRKYFLYLIKLTLLISILSGLAILGTKTVETFIKNIYQRNRQLYFFSLVRSRVELIHASVLDLIANGNVNRKVENLPILTFLSNSIQEITSLKSQVDDVFPANTIEKGSEIQKILYGDPCDFLNEYVAIFCTIIKKNGITPSFVQSLTVYENYLTDFYAEYIQLDETQRLFYKPEYKAINFIYSIYIIGGILSPSYLLESMDKVYEEMLDDSKGQRNLFFGTFTSAFVILIIVFWGSTLKELKEINNRFKQVLEVFPPYLILSNFYFKSFLIKTSKGALDFVKNGI